MSTAPLPTADDWRRVHAFGLPSGSIRALLALLVFGTAWGLILLRPDLGLPDFLRDLLFIILGHYFAVRRRANVAPEVGPPPLWLPNGTIRIVAVFGFVTTGILLARGGRVTSLEAAPGAVTLVLVGGFLLGVLINQVGTWFGDKGVKPPRIVEDLRALLALTAAIVLMVLVWNRFLPEIRAAGVGFRGRLPRVDYRVGGFGLDHALAAIVGFYFGSRS